LETPEFIENILRTQADVIYCSTLPRAMQTAEKVQKIFQEYRGKEVGIIYDERLATEGKTIKSHEEILKNHS
jgi:phosphohistidine phosphatase SixA